KLKLRAGTLAPAASVPESSELSSAAILSTPRCHPDGAVIRRAEKAAEVAEGYQPRPDSGAGFAAKVTFDALGSHIAEPLTQKPLLAGDSIDIAFSIGHNDHPEYGGLELSLRDFKVADNGSRPI